MHKRPFQERRQRIAISNRSKTDIRRRQCTKDRSKNEVKERGQRIALDVRPIQETAMHNRPFERPFEERGQRIAISNKSQTDPKRRQCIKGRSKNDEVKERGQRIALEVRPIQETAMHKRPFERPFEERAFERSFEERGRTRSKNSYIKQKPNRSKETAMHKRSFEITAPTLRRTVEGIQNVAVPKTKKVETLVVTRAHVLWTKTCPQGWSNPLEAIFSSKGGNGVKLLYTLVD